MCSITGITLDNSGSNPDSPTMLVRDIKVGSYFRFIDTPSTIYARISANEVESVSCCNHCNMVFRHEKGETCGCYCSKCHGEIDGEGWCPNYCMEDD